jgi:2-polyprenyl-3-methyl-5-hydroxy-6-metoxy-1,4-benzoquinol methylase
MEINSGVIVEVEDVNCAICGADKKNPIYAGYDIEFRTCDNKFQFCQCLSCQHVYLSPRPSTKSLSKIYENYLTSNTSSAYYPSALIAWIKSNIFDRGRMRRVTAHLKEGSNILDIGAGAGRLLQLLQANVPHKVNLYANEVFFDEATKQTLRGQGIHLYEGLIDNYPSEIKFDLIIGIHVIEHVQNPKKVFCWILEHLNPGGILYFETPDFNAFIRKIFKDDWGMMHFPRHFNLFSKKHLALLGTESGLEILHHGNTTSAPAWNMSIRNMAKLDALTKHKSIFEVFNYSNVFTLGFFTLVDILLLFFKVNTSTQQMVAQKPSN